LFGTLFGAPFGTLLRLLALSLFEPFFRPEKGPTQIVFSS
jgi:hypothetical protein